MDSKKAILVASTLEDLLSDVTSSSSVVVRASLHGSNSRVIIKPAKPNVSGSFFHAEEIVDVCRTFKVSHWMRAETDNLGFSYVCVHIY